MPIPDNFEPTEQFQDACKRVVNKLVKERFKDVELADGDVDITSARGALRTACSHMENDPINLTLGRLMLFGQICGFGLDQAWDLFGGDVERHLENVIYMPQIKLFFRESEFDTDPNFLPVTATVSFRIASETSESFTKANAEAIARKIQAKFANPTSYKWRKGKELYTYKDPPKGYNFQIYSFNEAIAKQLIRDCLSINEDSLKDELLSIHTSTQPSEAYPTLPPRKNVMGEMVQQPRKRPVATVAFRYAQLHLPGRIKPVTLVDTTYSFPNALIRA
jgi:hypothetical protein